MRINDASFSSLANASFLSITVIDGCRNKKYFHSHRVYKANEFAFLDQPAIGRD